jgi:hypothetical protein
MVCSSITALFLFFTYFYNAEASEKGFPSLNEITRILFVSERKGKLEIYSTKPDGSDILQPY